MGGRPRRRGAAGGLVNPRTERAAPCGGKSAVRVCVCVYVGDVGGADQRGGRTQCGTKEESGTSCQSALALWLKVSAVAAPL